jgi:hypothetical protein
MTNTAGARGKRVMRKSCFCEMGFDTPLEPIYTYIVQLYERTI